MDAALANLVEQVRVAAAARQALRIRGGGSKDFYGNPCAGEPLDTRALRGIVAYEPSELVVTARAGTPLAELESTLAAAGPMLAFEPPHFGAAATVGGCVAAGLAGPRRASAGTSWGALRDFVLGTRLLDGRAQLLAFGGTVMKNVAGYDLSRVLAGSLGILGVIVEVSLKVLPRPAAEATLRFAMDERQALRELNAWGGRPLPLSASAWHDGTLQLRLSGARAAVDAAHLQLGGELAATDVAAAFWTDVREQRLSFFAGAAPLWRLSLPSVAPPLELEGPQLIEWGGALRWLRTQLPAAAVRARAAELGGHATLFRGADRTAATFTPLAPPLAAIHQRLKAEFDPAGIFNRGRMYAEY
ncbi:MAG: glycolate oxidase subunit GlcE [Steroidobacteraceae bacterium]